MVRPRGRVRQSPATPPVRIFSIDTRRKTRTVVDCDYRAAIDIQAPNRSAQRGLFRIGRDQHQDPTQGMDAIERHDFRLSEGGRRYRADLLGSERVA